MRTKQAIWEVFTGLGLVAAMVMAAQPLMHPLHVLLHHSPHAEHEHTGCGHDHAEHHSDTKGYPHGHVAAHRGSESDQNEPRGDSELVDDAPFEPHADCRVCRLLSLNSRYQALAELQDFPAIESASVPASVAVPASTPAIVLAASGRAPPVTVG